MELLLLSGNSLSNKPWIEKVERKLKDLFDKTTVIYYRHWEENKPVIQLELEMNRLKEVTDGVKDLVIFAKSVGAVLTIKSVMDGLVRPVKCVFVGLPLLWAKDRDIDVAKWVENYKIPTLFIQQDKDPYLSYDELEKFLKDRKVSNYKLSKVPGHDHDYTDLDLIRRLVKEFVND